MNSHHVQQRLAGIFLFVTILVSCAFPIASGTSQAEFLTAELRVPGFKPPLHQDPQSTGVGDIFRLVSTVRVTPDEQFDDGALGYIHYIPKTNRFVVMLAVQLESPVTLTYSSDTCEGKAIAYKEYAPGMQPTGAYGYISCVAADATSQIIGNEVYLASMYQGPMLTDPGSNYIGWRLEKFDPVTWGRLAVADVPLDWPYEMDDGPTISMINGLVTVSGEYFPDGTPSGPLGRGSHHHFFTPDLVSVDKKILMEPDTPSHCPEVSLMQEEGGDILMFASTDYMGTLEMLRFDESWTFIEQVALRENAFFPTGVGFDGQFYYVGYTDTSKADQTRRFRNIGLAAYDLSWNTLQDETVTDIENTADTWVDGESPWVQLHGNHLYLSYIITTLEPTTGMLIESQTYVNIYKLNRKLWHPPEGKTNGHSFLKK